MTAPSHLVEPHHGPPDNRNPPGGGSGGFGQTSLLGSFGKPSINSNLAPAQAQNPRNPIAVPEVRLWMIREELFGDFDEIRIFAERGLRALEVENDLDLGRAFDQSFKHFRVVAANLKALLLVKTGAPR